ncbi:PBECR2 nuclease fold domain-containing protein [Helicobacter sp. MIT 14-3879]|uniref:PBECR2 nuclease fold domain-containing protein n=1 Tax=Helicobacter sp. MIT 14-3879 TaxID=2040649 RepID=UPI000E1F064A|nr:PBECR2 nuclease fold domain-containing protein [Helicobacter sp. MIT 14-3879]RDU61865.1 hypothetical protein CQA44_08020 [Helicobacter sp. MIT 14-3879]
MENTIDSNIFSDEIAKNIIQNLAKNKNLAYDLNPKADILKLIIDFSNPIKTPLFETKINMDKLLNHLAEKKDVSRRLEYINLIKPTLEQPLFISKDNDRYKFVKTFIDNDKVIKFLSVIEDDKGNFIGITATPIKNTDLKNLLKGNIVWGGDTLSALSTPQIAKQEAEATSKIIRQKSIKSQISSNEYKVSQSINRKGFINLIAKSKRENLDYLKKLAKHKNKNNVKSSSHIDSNDTLSIKSALAILLDMMKGIKKSLDEYKDFKEFNKQKEVNELQSNIKQELKVNQNYKKELDRIESGIRKQNKTNDANFTRNNQRLRHKQ